MRENTYKAPKTLSESNALVGAKGVNGGSKVPRRSVTITDQNNLEINRFRGRLLAADVNANYATILNMFLEVGSKILSSTPWSQETIETAIRYLFDRSLTDEGVIDEFVDIFNKRLWEEKKRDEEQKVKQQL